MDIKKISEDVMQVSLNYKFFEFQAIEQNNFAQFYFPIKQMRSFQNSGARILGKHITRTLSLTQFQKTDTHEHN